MTKILMILKKLIFRTSFQSRSQCVFPSPFEEAIILTLDGWANGPQLRLQLAKEIKYL